MEWIIDKGQSTIGKARRLFSFTHLLRGVFLSIIILSFITPLHAQVNKQISQLGNEIKKDKTTRILFILDASVSMLDPWSESHENLNAGLQGLQTMRALWP
jgi:hypothetical protein